MDEPALGLYLADSLMRKCTAPFDVPAMPVYTGTSAWNREAGMRVDAILNTQPSGY